MPRLNKTVLALYAVSDCARQLRLALTPGKSEQLKLHMPPRQPPPPGLEHIRREGDAWQAEKLDDLTRAFTPVMAAGTSVILGRPQVGATGQIEYKKFPLEVELPGALPGQFLVEAQYSMEATTKAALGITHMETSFGLEYADVRPDIIEVFPAGHFTEMVLPDGAVAMLAAGDTRRQLRIIDIKLTAAIGPRYQIEIAYYTILLAGWLIDHHFDRDFVVVPDGALWPGSHDASALTKLRVELDKEGRLPTFEQVRDALQEEIEPVPFDIFSYRVRRFLREELPAVLAEPDWRDLPWHVDARCRGCDYLGEKRLGGDKKPTWHPSHCLPMAESQGHLSRVAFVSRGASDTLRARGIADVPTLAARTPADPAFNDHQELRAMRTVLTGRANAFDLTEAFVPAKSGTSGVMPKWADLRVYISADFDQGSAITFALGIEARWIESRPYRSPITTPRDTHRWGTDVFVVDERSTKTEQREVLAFLRRVNLILAEAQKLALDHGQDPNEITVQFYLWDMLQYEHLARVIGRHLVPILADQSIASLAWLFPPEEEVLANPALATRGTPITIVRDVVRAVLAAPLAHHYGLLETASVYHPLAAPPSPSAFNVHPLFRIAMSDMIPSERAHEIWSKATAPRHWTRQLGTLRETVEKRLAALRTIVGRLEDDLDLDQPAPKINALKPPKKQDVLSVDGQLWYAFAKLNQALAEAETYQIRAMPPHEREARMHSARLTRRLSGADEGAALVRLGLRPRPGRRVYNLRSTSHEVKLRAGDFGFALAPELRPGFLNKKLLSYVQGTPLEPVYKPAGHTPMTDATGVTVVAIDRESGLIALDPTTRFPTLLDDLERESVADFSRNVILDPVEHDFFTARLKTALRAIGNPAAARENPGVRRALGMPTGKANRAAPSPAADALWDATALASIPVARTLGPTRAVLEHQELGLNCTQWRAWEAALTYRMRAIWGPPGTGKSRTARAIINGAAHEAWAAGRPIRILVCSATYKAIDNVLLDVYKEVRAILPGAEPVIRRLRSYRAPRDPQAPPEIDIALNRFQPSDEVRQLRERLIHPVGITIVGAPPMQVFNLLTTDDGAPLQPWFDIILIDEASQVDVAHAILALAALADDGSVILAGDPKQLPPIHPAEAPEDLGAMVGSIYEFCVEHHRVPAIMLDVNYRSNATIVDFARQAGYEASLTAYSPDLRLSLVDALPTSITPPPGWPKNLLWTPEWAALLDPDMPAVCFVYPEGRSSQWNSFEADAVAALLWLLHGRLANQLTNERFPGTAASTPPGIVPYAPDTFWQRAVGVVTPHRAQQGLIVGRLQGIFAGTGVDPALIRDAVDTVERFQGQERDVMIASFALGDADVIAAEDEFLLSLNRFNVMASRARAKLIVLVSREVVDHLSSDRDTLWGSRLLKRYVEAFCRDDRDMELGVLTDGPVRLVEGRFRHQP